MPLKKQTSLAEATDSLLALSHEAFKQKVREINGIGIHTGRHYALRVSPAPEGHGIEFFCRQPDGVFSAPARYTRLSGTSRSTALVLRGQAKRKLELRTVEHFLAAAFILGLRDLFVEISAFEGSKNASDEKFHEVFEMPILDGASKTWWDFLEPLANKDLKAQSFKAWLPARSFEVSDGAKRVLISPHSSSSDLSTWYHCAVRFEPSWEQSIDYRMHWQACDQGRSVFARDFAPARTFGFMHELKALEARGLAKGGSLENALVLDGDKIVNPGGFKVPLELAAHKLLDAVGDFALLEHPILGRIEVVQAGHNMHLRAVEEALRTGALVAVTVDTQGQIRRED